MDQVACRDFQESVSQYLIRHRSIMDVLSKLQESTARVNRALAKAVTYCGCVEVRASKQRFPADGAYSELRSSMDSHLHGELCEGCQEVLETEIGRSLFYLAASCALLGLDLAQILDNEQRRLRILGVYNLT